MEEVQRLAGEYNRYIRLKLAGDEGELAKALTGILRNWMRCIVRAWKSRGSCGLEEFQFYKTKSGCRSECRRNILDKETEFALELNNTSLYENICVSC